MDVTAISAFLQAELALRDIGCVSAVEAAGWLDSHGLLRDSASRPGKPLRDLLRAGRIDGQRQEANSRCFICRVDAGRPIASRTPTVPPAARAPAVTPSVGALAERLCDPAVRVSAGKWPASAGDVRESGLYSWWVDGSGAGHLSRGLGLLLPEGLIYAGQTGAGASAATLGSRIGRNHLAGNIRGSTFRWTLASILVDELGLLPTGHRRLAPSSESLLSRWMRDHLMVATVSVPDRSTLLAIETRVLITLDPPLNIQGMTSSPLRSRLSSLRSQLGLRR